MFATIFACILLCIAWIKVDSFASIAMNPYYCTQPLIEGEFIMNEYVVETTIRPLQVFRIQDDQRIEMKTGDSYQPGDIFEVAFAPSKIEGEHVYFVNGSAEYENGQCDGKRVGDAVGILKTRAVGEEEDGTISIYGGWARSHEQVKLTPAISLVPKSSSEL